MPPTTKTKKKTNKSDSSSATDASTNATTVKKVKKVKKAKKPDASETSKASDTTTKKKTTKSKTSSSSSTAVVKKKGRRKTKVVKKAPEEESSLKNAGSAAYWGFKAFKAMQACAGDVNALIEIGSEVMSEGLTDPTVVVDAMKSAVDLCGGMKRFGRSAMNFAQFSGVLAKQLGAAGENEDSAAVAQAQRFYKLFMEVDRDGNKSIDLQEYVVFCENEGISRSSAEILFYKADIDGNGSICFEEFAKMMSGRVGRDPEMFNCAAHHGMVPYTSPVAGMSCDFCNKAIAAGSLAAGCRRCDCDACGECYRANLPSAKDGGGAFDCRGRHGLEVTRLSVEASCDWCNKLLPVGSVAVACSTCDCDGCMECAATGLEQLCATPRTCPGRHGLEKKVIPGPGYACDACRQRLAAGQTVFGCSVCEVDVCVTCMWQDHRRVLRSGRPYSCPLNHELQAVFVMSAADLSNSCTWCLATPKMGDRIMRCGWCRVSVCKACLSSGFTPGAVRSARPPPGGAKMIPGIDGGPPPSPEPQDDFDGTPYGFDSVVRVFNPEDDEIDGRLMTAIGYERDCQGLGNDVVVLQCKNMVVREQVENVYRTIDV